MPLYRKKTLTEFVQFNKIGDHPAVHETTDSPTGFAIFTLEHTKIAHEVTLGDWIATGLKGEHYAVKPDIFETTYEKVSA